MKRSFTSLCGTALALMLFAATGARADSISFSYDWAPGQLAVGADTGGTGGISFTHEIPQSVIGPTNSVATDLRTFSDAHIGSPDTFTNTAYTLSLTIKDGGQVGTLNWGGAFNGTFSLDAANVTNTFNSALTQTTTINGHLYTVTLGPYNAPGVPGAQNAGSIGGFINVAGSTSGGGGTTGGGGGPPVDNNPEPSTALLTCLGASFLGLASWRKWKRARAA
jgi:hypothetical protein